MNIPESAIDAASKVTQEVCEAYDPGGWAGADQFIEWARCILEAAAPYLKADAWDEGAEAEPLATNPYRSQSS